MVKILLTISLLLPALTSAQDDALLKRIWDGTQVAQGKYTSACGSVKETRTSALLARPLIFQGKFCLQGMSRFSLEYVGTDPIRLRFNQDILNVTTGPSGSSTTEVLEVGSQVRRTQAYFSQADSLEKLKRNFTITVREEGKAYDMKFVPRSARFASRVNYVAVKLLKESFLPSSIEIDGKSGVHSVFDITIGELNQKIDDQMFSVYKPK